MMPPCAAFNDCAVVGHSIAVVSSHSSASAGEELDRGIDLLHEGGEPEHFFGVLRGGGVPGFVVDFPELYVVGFGPAVFGAAFAPF